MGAQKSAAIGKARKLLAKGARPAEAARKAGITPGAITRDAESAAIRATVGRIPSKSEQAHRFMLDMDVSATEAAVRFGIKPQAIHAFINRQRKKGTAEK